MASCRVHVLRTYGRRRAHAAAQAAWNAVKAAERPRVHVFLATSPIHMQFKLNMTEDQVVANSVKTVKHLRSLGCQDIEFSPEDATRCVLCTRMMISAQV